MDRAAFFKSVHDALARLYDLAYLANHPIGQHLSRDGSQLSPDLIHRLLLQGIEQVRPRVGMSATAPVWRQHRYLELRYLNGMSHEATANELGLSLRQAHRVRLAALDAVVASLWGMYCGEPSRPTDQPARARTQQGDVPSPTVHTTLDDELARYARNPADTPANLVEEIRGALEVTRPLASGRGVLVDVNAPQRNLPVAVGHTLLRQMVILLLSYALEYQSGGRLFLSADATGEEATLDVVFSERADEQGGSLSPQDSRLATARRLAEAQGGSLQALPVEGGRSLRLHLPSDRATTILVIDDNPDLACLFGLYLRGTRYRVIEANTGQSAVRMAEQGGPDVITLDVMMPFQDGWDIFHHLQDNPATKTIPIIVCSILPEKDLALSLGAAGFLAKPVTAQSLVATLDRCLESQSIASRGRPSDRP